MAALARGKAQIAAALDELDRERMIACATLAAALDRDLIGPGDFSPRDHDSDRVARR